MNFNGSKNINQRVRIHRMERPIVHFLIPFIIKDCVVQFYNSFLGLAQNIYCICVVLRRKNTGFHTNMQSECAAKKFSNFFFGNYHWSNTLLTTLGPAYNGFGENEISLRQNHKELLQTCYKWVPVYSFRFVYEYYSV